jgi:hypothetical protein
LIYASEGDAGDYLVAGYFSSIWKKAEMD